MDGIDARSIPPRGGGGRARAANVAVGHGGVDAAAPRVKAISSFRHRGLRRVVDRPPASPSRASHATHARSDGAAPTVGACPCGPSGPCGSFPSRSDAMPESARRGRRLDLAGMLGPRRPLAADPSPRDAAPWRSLRACRPVDRRSRGPRRPCAGAAGHVSRRADLAAPASGAPGLGSRDDERGVNVGPPSPRSWAVSVVTMATIAFVAATWAIVRSAPEASTGGLALAIALPATTAWIVRTRLAVRQFGLPTRK